MESKVVCEVLLNSYKHLEKLCKRCDEAVLTLATNSYNNDIFEVFDMIAKFSNQKNVYCNIKLVIDKAISKLKKNTELKYRYILGLRNIEIQKMLGLTQPVVTKRINSQKEKLFEYLQNKYTEEQLFDFIKDSIPLMEQYRRLCNENN